MTPWQPTPDALHALLTRLGAPANEQLLFTHVTQLIGPVGTGREEAGIGLRTFAARSGYTIWHCSRLLHRLKARGALEIIRLGRGRANVYRLTPMVLALFAELKRLFWDLPLKCMVRQVVRAKAKVRALLGGGGDLRDRATPSSKGTGGPPSNERRRGRDRSWADTPLGTYGTWLHLRAQGIPVPKGAWA